METVVGGEGNNIPNLETVGHLNGWETFIQDGSAIVWQKAQQYRTKPTMFWHQQGAGTSTDKAREYKRNAAGKLMQS